MIYVEYAIIILVNRNNKVVVNASTAYPGNGRKEDAIHDEKLFRKNIDKI